MARRFRSYRFGAEGKFNAKAACEHVRILHIGKFFPPFAGGIENFHHDLMLGLARRGVEQAAIVHHHERGRPTSKEVFEFNAGGCAEVWRIRTLGRMLYAPVAPSFGKALESVAASFRPDLVHVHVPNTSAFWLLRSRHLRNVPWILHWHSDVLAAEAEMTVKVAYRLYQPLEGALLRRSSEVIATSEPYLTSSLPLRPWIKKCSIVPLGLDPHRLEQQACVSGGVDFSADAPLKVLFVGRLSYYKGLSYLVEAVHRTSGVELVIAGAGDEAEKTKALARRFGLGSRVRFARAVSDAKKIRLMKEADVLCLPSISRHEAFGLVLVEAMGTGTPVIATRVSGSGMSWLVGDDGAGWLVEPRDSQALADLLTWLRDHREHLAPAGEMARRRFWSVFDIDAVAAEVAEIYVALLAQSQSAGIPRPRTGTNADERCG